MDNYQPPLAHDQDNAPINTEQISHTPYAPVWPPQPDNQSSSWPPMPGNEPQFRYIPFTFIRERVEGSVDDFRVGHIGIGRQGIIIQGKVIPRAEIYQTVLIIAFTITLLHLGYGSFIAYLIMRYGCLQDRVLTIPWEYVKSITSVPDKNKLCFVYEAPDNSGTIKTFSLTMKFTPADYAAVTYLTDTYVPRFVKPGKLHMVTNIFVCYVAVLVVIAEFIDALGRYLGVFH